MNRTERLYALVEELRAVAPRPRSASWLATRFDVSVRTVERDLSALRESGVVIRGDVGRTGGYFLDRARTLSPVTLTDREALAICVALRSAASSPFAEEARTAGQKCSPSCRRMSVAGRKRWPGRSTWWASISPRRQAPWFASSRRVSPRGVF